MKTLIANIEKQFEKLGYFIFARRWTVILVALLIFGALASQVTNIVIDTSNEAFLEPDELLPHWIIYFQRFKRFVLLFYKNSN